jgi:hypothetical protein
MDSHLDASTEDYEAKTKEFESVSHRVFGAMHSSGGAGMPGMNGMPGGMNMPGGMGGGMPNLDSEQMAKMQEMFEKMSPQEKENLMKMAGNMGDMGSMPGMPGFNPSEESSSGSDHNGTKIEEVD